jgi:acyl carrier protein
MQNTPDNEIAAALLGIRNRLDTLASINAENILIPGGPQERYHQIVDEAYVALGLVEKQIDELRTELEYQHKRLDEARDAALGKGAAKQQPKEASVSKPPKTAPVEERLKAVIVRAIECDEKDIVPSADLVNDLAADSLGLVKFVMFMEEEFQISITDDEADRMLTVRDVLEYLRRKGIV